MRDFERPHIGKIAEIGSCEFERSLETWHRLWLRHISLQGARQDDSPHRASGLSGLNFRVKPFQFDAGVTGGEAPVNSLLELISFGLPCLGLLA